MLWCLQSPNNLFIFESKDKIEAIMATYTTVIAIPTNVQRTELNKAVCVIKAKEGTYILL